MYDWAQKEAFPRGQSTLGECLAYSGRGLQLLTETVPKLTHMGVLWDGGSNPVGDREWAETHAAAQPFNVQLYSLEGRGIAALAPADHGKSF
jgi:hypothetical protein